jgi:hypothetical protein
VQALDESLRQVDVGLPLDAERVEGRVVHRYLCSWK